MDLKINTYIAILLECQTKKHTQEKRGKFYSHLFRIHRKFHGSIVPPKQCVAKNKYYQCKCPNGQIIRYTMEGGWIYQCYQIQQDVHIFSLT